MIHDSWAIACHLEDVYTDRPSLFGGENGRALARFINLWSDEFLYLSRIRRTQAPYRRSASCARSARFSFSKAASRARTGVSTEVSSASVKRLVRCWETVPVERFEVDDQRELELCLVTCHHDPLGKLNIVFKLLDLHGAQEFQASAPGVVHQDERRPIVGCKIADADVLPVATEVRERQGSAIEHTQKAGWPTSVLDIGPSRSPRWWPRKSCRAVR